MVQNEPPQPANPGIAGKPERPDAHSAPRNIDSTAQTGPLPEHEKAARASLPGRLHGGHPCPSPQITKARAEIYPQPHRIHQRSAIPPERYSRLGTILFREDCCHQFPDGSAMSPRIPVWTPNPPVTHLAGVSSFSLSCEPRQVPTAQRPAGERAGLLQPGVIPALGQPWRLGGAYAFSDKPGRYIRLGRSGDATGCARREGTALAGSTRKVKGPAGIPFPFRPFRGASLPPRRKVPQLLGQSTPKGKNPERMKQLELTPA